MNKKMRELQKQIFDKVTEAQKYMEGETKDLVKAEELLNEVDSLQKEYELEARVVAASKASAPADPQPVNGQPDGFSVMAKMVNKKALTDKEAAALISGPTAENGENNLVPEDVKLAINELRKSYVSARELVTVETTSALTGSVTYEAGTPTGLADFTDGGEIAEDSGVKFVNKNFAIKWKGKLIPISRILSGAEKAGLLSYLNRWFVKNATISENTDIFAALKSGYNSGTPKAVAGWEALKSSINVDLDPSCLIGGVIATNQSGFAALDKEKFEDGRPVLQANPANPTEKIFQGLPVKVYPDALLPNIDSTHFPMFYGNTKAGCTMKEYDGLTFDTSEHFLFNKNQNCLRVLEGYDVMSTDTSAYIYGSFSATVSA